MKILIKLSYKFVVIAFYGLFPSSTIYTCYLNTIINGVNNPKNKWVMRLLSTLGVREFEPKCADPVSDENISITFFMTH